MKNFYNEYVKTENDDLRNDKKYNQQDVSLRGFLFSGKDLLRDFGYILLAFVWIVLRNYDRVGTLTNDDYLYFAILGVFITLPSLIGIIKWIVMLVVTHPTSRMSLDYNNSKIFFNSSVAVGKEYLFISEQHKAVLIEECGNINVEKCHNDVKSWLVFSVYTVKKKRPIKFCADIDPVKQDYYDFEKCMIKGNSKLEYVMPELREKLRHLGVLAPILDEKKKAQVTVYDMEVGELVGKVIDRVECNVGKAVKTVAFSAATINSSDYKEGIAYFNGSIVLGKKHMYINNTGSVIDYHKVIHVMIEEKRSEYIFSVIVKGKTDMPTFTTEYYDGISNDIQSIETELLTRCKNLKKDSFKILRYNK